jgi:hypothetical protein
MAAPNAGFDAGLSEARKKGWDIHEVPSGHDVMIDASTRSADIIERLCIVTPGYRS